MMDAWLRANLACPRHHGALADGPDALICGHGCRYPIVDGVPVMLLDEVPVTLDVVRASLRRGIERGPANDLYVDTLSLSDEERQGILRLAERPAGGVDPVVSYLVAATNGIAYKNLVGQLSEYPVPELRLPAVGGRVFLDLGCGWGRWCVAAGRKGYRPVGIDPSLGAVMAARRVARQLGIDAAFLVGDARYLPFGPGVIDTVFSYSVVQHFSREDAARVVSEVGRVLKPGGESLIQMPTKLGIRCLYHQARRRFRDGSGFEVRYWSIPSLQRLFSSSIGPTRNSVDCYFGIGLQFADLHLMPARMKPLVVLSEAFRLASRFLRPLVWVADSVYLSSVKSGPPRAEASGDGARG